MANGAVKAKRDKFANRAQQRIVQSAANTLTFEQINFAVGIFQGVAVLIHRIIYHVGYTFLDNLIGADDTAQVALTSSDNITQINNRIPEVIDSQTFFCYIIPAATAGRAMRADLITDFTTFPMGGILVAANPMYVALDSSSIVDVLDCDCELWFSFVELSDADYIELIQSRLQANI